MKFRPVALFLAITLIVAVGGSVWLSDHLSRGVPLWKTLKDPTIVVQLKQFVFEKKSQADAATNEPAPGFAPFFAAAEKGEWLAVSNRFEDFRQHAPQFYNVGKPDDMRLTGPRWEAVKEVWGAFKAFSVGDERYAAAFGRDIIAAIPPGSIYFGGTDPGRFIVTAMCRSQVKGDPFFVLTQNALVGGDYLDYLRSIYANRIYLPDANDMQRCFYEYTKDLQERSRNNQLKPGENFQLDSDGRAQISGQVDVMEINARLVRVIFDKNPEREFFVEESFPLEWMHPHLEPHGLIFKLDREPLPKLSDETVQKDHDYWTEYIKPMIGDWLRDDTSIKEIVAFAKRTFADGDLSGFHGDPNFIQNEYTQEMISKLRCSIAGVYAWREENSTDDIEKERMARAADYAFRQAWALCPYSPETSIRYVNFLLTHHRIDDALLLEETVAAMPQIKGAYSEQAEGLVKQLKAWQVQFGAQVKGHSSTNQ